MAPHWLNRTVIGIIRATFLSDFSHEMCTAVLPLYLSTLGLGPAALGLIKGVADFLVSLSKLAGGVVGHHLRHKRPWASLGYLLTTLATWAIALVQGLVALISLRGRHGWGEAFAGRCETTCWPMRSSRLITDEPMAWSEPGICSGRSWGRSWPPYWCGAGSSSVR